ncbi:MAG: restriction endonuclease subunit S [Saprospiraceae bacterium]|nr:restriction endonuclease subunit S [Saprospiraceae bacterium]
MTGKLTEDWRGSKSVDLVSPITIGNLFVSKPESWQWEKLISLAKLESGHTPRKSNSTYWEGGDVPWISLQDIRAAHGRVINDTKLKPNMKGINNSSARILPQGTVCFSRDISVGFTTIMGREMATTQHFANWICKDFIYNKYLLYAFMAARNFLIGSGQGTTVKTIYMPALRELMLMTPPIKEQQEIVSRLESLTAKVDAIETQYKNLKEKIDQLPQAVLAEAFQGELVEQLPDDGDARDLLAEIKKKRVQKNLKKKSQQR